jgi:hypothetical protein
VTFPDQVATELAAADALAESASLPALAAAVAEVRAQMETSPWAVRYSGALGGPGSWTGGGSCAYTGRAGANAAQRAAYLALCGAWEDRVKAALGLLALELKSAGASGQAETAISLGDQAATMGDQAALTVGTPKDWWESVPGWVKLGGGLVAFLVVANAVGLGPAGAVRRGMRGTP